MPTGVFARRPKTQKYSCHFCDRKFAYEKRYHSHLDKCTRAPKVEKPEERNHLRDLASEVELLRTTVASQQKTIQTLLTELGNVKRSLHHVKVRQQANDDLFTQRVQNLKRDEFLLRLQKRAAGVSPSQQSEAACTTD